MRKLLCLFMLAGLLLAMSDPPLPASIIDSRDQQPYPIIRVGDLIWFQKNLNYALPGSVCYDSLPENCAIYGRLYSYNQAKTACPEGWRIPTVEDWKNLRKLMKTKKADQILLPGSWEGAEYQQINNALGLSILPAGRMDAEIPEWRESLFGELGASASFWLDDPKEELHWHIRWGKSEIHRHGNLADQGQKFSIRCVCEKIPKAPGDGD